MGDFKKLAGISPSRPSMSESKGTPALDEVPETIIGSGARTVEMSEPLPKLGLASAPRNPKPVSGVVDPNAPIKKGKPASTPPKKSMEDEEALDKYYAGSGEAHMASHLAMKKSAEADASEFNPTKQMSAYHAHKGAAEAHRVAKELMKVAGVDKGKDIHDQKIVDHENAMVYHGANLDM